MDISRILPFNLAGGLESLLSVQEYILEGLIIAGVLILLASLVPTFRLIAQMPPGRIRRNWQVLRVLIIVFIFGYISFAVVSWNGRCGGDRTISHFVVPVVFFLGACFVYLVNKFALEATVLFRRISVLELESITDTLLGIHNRRYLDSRLKQEFHRAIRYKLPLSVLLMDIDHFKKINDTYGHQIGDFVLTSIGKLILSTARNTDIVARFGEDEIMIIATNTPFANIFPFAERLRKAVADAVLVPPGEFTGGVVICVTVSIGVAAVGPETGTVNALTESVTDALASAKAHGRDIVFFDKPDATVV
jgi:diguanylate cyclase (GGDEF)-like protein